MQVHWNVEDRTGWEAHTEQARSGLQQSWSYGQAMMALQVPVLRAVVTEGTALRSPWRASAQFIVHRLPWVVRLAYCPGGPAWSAGLPLSAQKEALDRIRRTLPLKRPRLVLFSPHEDLLQERDDPHPFFDRVRLATGGSTVLLDLTLPPAQRRAAQEGRWRNRLNAAERSGLKIEVCGARAQDVQWLVQAEAQQRQQRRYISLPSGFVEAYLQAHRKPSQALLTLAAKRDAVRCAGMMFLVHGKTATYHLGWTDDTGRTHSAHNLLLWQACQLLAERGVEQLDLGGVNTRHNPGLARFKLGTGGRVVTWAGTFA